MSAVARRSRGWPALAAALLVACRGGDKAAPPQPTTTAAVAIDAAPRDAAPAPDAAPARTPAELRPAVEQFFADWDAGRDQAIVDRFAPAQRAAITAARVARSRTQLVATSGGFQAIATLVTAAAAKGGTSAQGTARFANGVYTYDLTFAPGDPLQLAGFRVTPPPELATLPPAADAIPVAKAALDALRARDLARFTAVAQLDVVDEVAPDFARRLEEVWGYFGAIKSVTAVPTPDCKATCVKYAVVGAKGSGSVYFSLTVDINRWFVAHFDISPPPP